MISLQLTTAKNKSICHLVKSRKTDNKMDSDEDIMYDDVDSDEFGEEEANDVDSDEFEEEDVEYAMDTTVAGSSREKAPEVEFPYEILSSDKIVQHMANSIKEVNTVVEMPATITRILLNYFNWDKQKLMDRYYDGDQEKLFEAANLTNCLKSSHAPGTNGFSNNSMEICNSTDAEEDCEVCYVTLPASKLTGLECGHRFCKDCWNDYLKTKIIEEGVVQTIECAAHSCNVLIDDMTVMNLLKDAKVKRKYQLLITNSFVDCNKLLKWCPTPECGHAIKTQYIDAKPVTCKCKHTFCFGCGENWHEPVNCTLIKKWLTKCQDESETSKWIAANTKECPKCKAIIEKASGCNYVKCAKCKSAFCWFCLHTWDHDQHTWKRCNRFDEKQIADIEDDAAKIRAVLERYLFYNNRYMNHMQSLKFENDLYVKVEEMQKVMQQHNMTWIEVQFLKTAVDILCSCRQILMYSYVFAFYLEKSNQTAIFEDNQQDLESAIETLSGYLERDMAEENLVEIKQKVQDKYRYCDTRRKVLLEHVNEGNENDWWKYRDL